MEEEMLELIWTNHSPIFRYWFTEHREKEKYTDATIGCEGKLYAVHKLVLATCSSYFDEVFEHTEGKHPVLLLHDVRQHELEAILCYMYTGSANVSQLNLARFMMVARALQIKGLAVPDGDSCDPLTTEMENSQVETDRKRIAATDGYCWQQERGEGSFQSMSDTSESQEVGDGYRGGGGPVAQRETIKVEESKAMKMEKRESSNQYSFPGFNYKTMEGPDDEDLIKKREVLEKIISQTERQFISDGKQQESHRKMEADPQADSVTGLQHGNDDKLSQKKVMKKGKQPSSSGPSKFFKGNGKRNLNGQKKSNIGKLKVRGKYQGMKKRLLSHSVAKTYQCPECPASFARKYSLHRHLQSHVEAEDFLCTYCHARFPSKEFLKVHMETHDRNKPYVCTLCHMSFSRKDKLTVHMRNHEAEDKGKIMGYVKNFSERVYLCNECSATFESHTEYVEHSQMHAGEKQFPCTVCPAAFAKKVHLSRHVLTHKGFGSRDKIQDIN